MDGAPAGARPRVAECTHGAEPVDATTASGERADIDGNGDDTEEEDEAQRRADAEEQAALARIVRAFRDYPRAAEAEVARWAANYAQLPPHHRRLLGGLPAKVAAAKRAIETNTFLIRSLLQAYDPDMDTGPLGTSKQQQQQQPQVQQQQQQQQKNQLQPGDAGPGPQSQAAQQQAAAAAAEGEEEEEEDAERVNANDVDKVRYVLKNLARDWSEEGAPERALSYGRIVAELKATFAGWSNPHRPPRVLVPGAGLARLCVEVAGAGYEAQGNEFSYYMLLASSFMLNYTTETRQYTVHPWLHSNCNHRTDADQLRPLAVPDVLPGQLVAAPGLLSMCAGDFVEVYSAPDMACVFDAVATCFFLDTGHNVLAYMEAIAHVLPLGGTWVNLGPLLYHWADAHTYLRSSELSVEPSLDDVMAAAAAMGFRLVRHEMVDAPYMADPRSMYKTVYQAAFWTMVKEREYTPPPPPPPPQGQQQQQQPSPLWDPPPPPPPRAPQRPAGEGEGGPAAAAAVQQQQQQQQQQEATDGR